MVSVNKCLIFTSVICDLVPGLSTGTNLATFGFKAVAAQGWLPGNVENNEFAQYLIGKSKLRCAVLLVPRYGNIAFVVYKLFSLVISKGIQLIPTLPDRQPPQFPKSLQEGFDRYDQEVAKLRAAIEESERRASEAEENRKAQIEKGMVEFEAEFLENISSGYVQRVGRTKEFFKKYLKFIQSKTNDIKEADSFGQSVVKRLRLLHDNFKTNIDYSNFNIATIRIGEERKNQMLGRFMQDPNILPLRQELHTLRGQCIEKTLEVVRSYPPNAETSQLINEYIQKLSQHMI